MPKSSSKTPTELSVVGVDIGKDFYSHRRLRSERQDRPATQDQTSRTDCDVREAAALHSWHGGVPQRALCQSYAAQIGFRAKEWSK